MVAQNNDQLAARRELRAVFAEQFAKETFAVVSLNGVADASTGHYAKLRRASLRRKTALENERSALNPVTGTADLLEFAGLAQAY